jgi:hypothetical protein
MHAAEEDAQGFVPRRHRQQMHMVGHQAPSQESDLGVAEILAQQTQVGEAIFVGGEGLAPVHAPLGDVAWDLGQHASASPRHGRHGTPLAEKTSAVQAVPVLK